MSEVNRILTALERIADSLEKYVTMRTTLPVAYTPYTGPVDLSGATVDVKIVSESTKDGLGAAIIEETGKKKRGRPAAVTTKTDKTKAIEKAAAKQAEAKAEENMSEEDFRAEMFAYAKRKGTEETGANVVAAKELMQRIAGKDMVKDVPAGERRAVVAAALADV